MMNTLHEQAKPRQDVIDALRAMAGRRTTVRELVREVQTRLGFKSGALIPVLWYFTQTFGLPLQEVLPIREWLGTENDEDIDALILPKIAATREQWMRPEL